MALTIDFSAVGYIENLDVFSRVIDRINNSIVADSDAIEIAVRELLSPGWPWMDFKLK